MAGSDDSGQAGVFCPVYQTVFRQLPNDWFLKSNLAGYVNVCFLESIGKGFRKFFIYGSFSPKTSKFKGSNRHLTLTGLQPTRRTAERYRSLHVVFQGPESFNACSTFSYDLRCRSYVASNFANFRIFAYFPHTKRLKSTFLYADYSPGVTSGVTSQDALGYSV